MLTKIIRRLKEKDVYFEKLNDKTIAVYYSSDVAMLKLSKDVGISNGGDGYHKLVISSEYPDEATTGTLVKLDRFSFYNYDLAEKPLFSIKGFTMVFEVLDMYDEHDYFHVMVS